MSPKKKILIVDEEYSYRKLLKEVLTDKYQIIDTGSYSESVSLAELNKPELILIDVEVAGIKGVELCETLKENPKTDHIPVLLITSLVNKDDIIHGLRAGASDYIMKPMCLPEVFARIESHLRTQEDYAELEHRDLLMLLELTEAISVTRSPNAILRLIVNKMSKIIDVARCSVITLTEERKIFVKASSDLKKKSEIELDLKKYPEIRKSIESKQSVIINDIKNNPIMYSVRKYIDKLDYNSVIVIPLIKKESVIGTFFLRTASREKGGNKRVYKLCQLVASIAANALENATLFESIKTAQEHFEEVSIRDDLTKLFNRRHFYNRLKEEFSRAVRYNEPISLAFIDVDNFKKINDFYGHQIGDSTLKQIGELLKSAARESDLPARCGGDEFAILLPNTDAEGGLIMAKRISELIHSHRFDEMKGKKISTSIGVATAVDNNMQSFEDLVKMADDAMYVSKKTEKGQVIMAPKILHQTKAFEDVGFKYF